MKNLTGLILNGGLGVRLMEVTGGETPKGHIEFNEKPLITYHIEMLKRLGAEDVVLAYTHESQVKQFKELVKKGKIPDLPYIIDIYSSKEERYHPTLAFKSDFLKLKILGKSLIKIHSDNVFSYKDLYNLFSRFQENGNVSLAIGPTAKVDSKESVSRMFAAGNELQWNSALTILNSNAIDYLFERIERNTFNGIADVELIVLRHLLREGIDYNIYTFKNLINMNTYKDYVVACGFFEKAKKS